MVLQVEAFSGIVWAFILREMVCELCLVARMINVNHSIIKNYQPIHKKKWNNSLPWSENSHAFFFVVVLWNSCVKYCVKWFVFFETMYTCLCELCKYNASKGFKLNHWKLSIFLSKYAFYFAWNIRQVISLCKLRVFQA